jgi:hypothetical protein
MAGPPVLKPGPVIKGRYFNLPACKKKIKDKFQNVDITW